MLGNLLARSHFRNQLLRLDARCQSARKVGATTCQKCGFCCWRAPGGFLPEDVKALAHRNGLTLIETFEHYLTVHDLGKTDGLYTVIPIRHQQTHEAGGYLSSRGSFDINAPCIFLNEDTSLCSLHGTSAQPMECRETGVTCLNDGSCSSGRDPRSWTPEMLQEMFDFDIEAAKCQDDYNDDF